MESRGERFRAEQVNGIYVQNGVSTKGMKRSDDMSGKFSFFQNSAGLLAVAARFEDDNVWLTQAGATENSPRLQLVKKFYKFYIRAI